MNKNKNASDNLLKREIGLPGAVMMGMGAMVRTGVFVSIGIAAGVAGLIWFHLVKKLVK